jgi:hypothetical protein
MDMRTLTELQYELPIISRFRMNDSSASQIAFDDAGGLALAVVGSPSRGLTGMCKNDTSSCSSGSVGNYWAGPIEPWTLTKGLAVEAVICQEPNGRPFGVILAPGQFELKTEGETITWVVKTTLNRTLVASNALLGWPQHIVCNYDIAAGLQSIYVDGVLAASSLLAGSVSGVLSGVVSLLKAETTKATNATGQDIAIYGCALSSVRVKQHFAAFRQLLGDPGHVRQHGQIGVTS